MSEMEALLKDKISTYNQKLECIAEEVKIHIVNKRLACEDYNINPSVGLKESIS